MGVVDVERAMSYIMSNGDVVERARLRYLLYSEPPPQDALDQLFLHQRPDGGWSPFWAANYSSLDATCFHLAKAEQLGVDGSCPEIAGAIGFLQQRQRGDGSWEEESRVAAQAPPWAKPGNLAARLYLTANCGFWLALSDPRCDGARLASAHLGAYLTDEGNLPAPLHAYWLAGGLWSRLQRQDETGRVLESLRRRLSNRVRVPGNREGSPARGGGLGSRASG